MTDNLSYSWRYILLADIMPTSRLIDDLERAGYYCAGDVLDAEPETLAADVYGVGLRRAELIRQKVFDHVKPFGSTGVPDWVLVEPTEAATPEPSLGDRLVTGCALIAVALLVYMTVRVLL
jgi:hypothetical protein